MATTDAFPEDIPRKPTRTLIVLLRHALLVAANCALTVYLVEAVIKPADIMMTGEPLAWFARSSLDLMQFAWTHSIRLLLALFIIDGVVYYLLAYRAPRGYAKRWKIAVTCLLISYAPYVLVGTWLFVRWGNAGMP